jgi:Flp pilus assembly protein TadG
MDTAKYNRHVPRRAGIALVYMLIVFAALSGMVSLAVDFGRVSLDRSALQVAADAAARHGAEGLPTGAEYNNAINAAAANLIEGHSVVLQTADIQVGVWNSISKTFTVTTLGANAIKVSARLSADRGTAIPTLFASVLGSQTCNVHASAIATVAWPTQSVVSVPGTSDPWLAGMPNGTQGDYYSAYGDVAPTESPVQMPLQNMAAGQVLNFQFTGSVSNWSGDNTYGCDGDPDYVGCNWWAQANGNSEHGIANVTAPIAAVIGVFLGNSEPDSTSAPAALDFSTASSQDFATLSPLLKQPFFIGDGLRADGVTLQGFVVPAGATRLYVGCMDFQEWSDNSGTMSTTVTTTPTVALVN